MLPNYYRKIISGQVLFRQVWDYSRKIITNHLGMVTRYEIERNEMGNRVTKSNSLSSLWLGIKNNSSKQVGSVFVKVQRADGSWLFLRSSNNLRCALLVFEKYYITKILSK